VEYVEEVSERGHLPEYAIIVNQEVFVQQFIPLLHVPPFILLVFKSQEVA
jgi:hypothetical protein